MRSVPGLVPHSLLWKAFSYSQVPEKLSAFQLSGKAYFEDIQSCFNTSNYTISWQHLEIGIMAGCAILSLAFTVAMEAIIWAPKMGCWG